MTLKIIKKFLWLPKKDNNKWYWLEKVSIVKKEITYNVIEYPLLPEWPLNKLGLTWGGPIKYQYTKYEFVGIIDKSNAIEVFIPNKNSPEP